MKSDTPSDKAFISNTGSLDQRVWLERVERFFHNAKTNMVGTVVGAAFIWLILADAGASHTIAGIWFTLVTLQSLLTGVIERLFQRRLRSSKDIRWWVSLRMLLGSSIGLTWGVSVFLLPENSPFYSDLFIFITMTTMMTVAGIGYSIMPNYFLLLNASVFVPLIARESLHK